MIKKMPKYIEETFLFGGKKIVVKDKYTDEQRYIKMIVDTHEETVEPVDGGFLTGPSSEISKLFGQRGVMHIPAACAKLFADRIKRFRFVSEMAQFKKWASENGAAHAGLLYGEIKPGYTKGWYIVLMMQVRKYGGYIDYTQPGSEFLGEHPRCIEIYKARGAGGVFNNGTEFFVTLLDKKEVMELLETRKI
jgi:hypothetical protein